MTLADSPTGSENGGDVRNTFDSCYVRTTDEIVPLAQGEDDLLENSPGEDTVDGGARPQRPKLRRDRTLEFEPNENNNHGDVEDGSGAPGTGARDGRIRVYSHSVSYIKNFNANTYAGKKTLTQGMLDIALLSANSSYLKLLCQQYINDQEPHFFWILIGMLSFSISLQLVTAFLLFFKLKYNINKTDHQSRADRFNNIATVLVIVITALNVFIASFSDTAAPKHKDVYTEALGISGTPP